MDDRYDSEPRDFREYERRVDAELEQLEWEEEQRRDGLLKDSSRFSGDFDLYRDMRRGK